MTPLTPMQTRTMLLVCQGMSNKIIAETLSISEHTAKFHVYCATRRLGADNRTLAAVRFALANVDDVTPLVVGGAGA